MTPAQFEALAELLRLRTGPSRDVSRMVLVEGFSVSEAARDRGISYHLAYKAVKRAQDGLILASKAVDPA